MFPALYVSVQSFGDFSPLHGLHCPYRPGMARMTADSTSPWVWSNTWV